MDESMKQQNNKIIYRSDENVSPYDFLINMIRGLELEDDAIVMTRKIKAIETDFCNTIKDENMLCESMNYINAKSLDDGELALKFALLFSSRNFDALAMKEVKVRSAMLKILETNFLNADTFRLYDKEKLYNSITLLGEYYHRVRLADNSPITILGESLIGLLIREMEGNENTISRKLAKLVLSQMTLNGDILRARHGAEVTQLLYHIRRNLVEQTQLSSTTKALLLMTLDLYYSNFANLGVELETFYTKYLVNQEQDENMENGKNQHAERENNDVSDTMPTTKKWSEQVCEDPLYDNELTLACDRINSNNNTSQRNSLEHEVEQQRSPQSMPRPLKHNGHDKRGSRDRLNFNSARDYNHEEDQAKPLPRWRAARFNRDDEQNNEYLRNRFRRASGSFDDDHQSIQSEGGIRLYSVKDRQRHSQEKIDRSSNYNFIVNSNWDRQSQRDDRSERSYISNYEYGNANNQRRGYRNYNSRPNYDKPPRFQKNRKQQHHQQQHQEQHLQQQQHSAKDEKHTNENNWRRTRTNSNNTYCDEDQTRASTLPRPNKAHSEHNIKSTSFRRSQSPRHLQHHHQQQQQQQHKGGHYNDRFENGEEDCLPNRSGRRFQPRKNQRHNQQRTPDMPHIDNWQPTDASSVQHDEADDHSELVRNARQTTKYMNYLSSKK